MTTYKFGDIVVARIRFSNQQIEKPRPVVVVSGVDYNARKPDIIVVSISSNLQCDDKLGEFLISDLSLAGLNVASRVKAFISTIDPEIIKYSIGTLNATDGILLRNMLEKLFRSE